MTFKNKYLGETRGSLEKYGRYKVEAYLGQDKYLVKFYNGYTVEVVSQQIKYDSVYNPYHPKIHGVGYKGCGVYSSAEKGRKEGTKLYSTWGNMLKRCYSPEYKEYHLYGGKGVSVCKNWHNFQNFAKWYEENVPEKWHMDKDILVDGNLIYSESTCIGVPAELNGFVTSSINRRGRNTYTGVYYVKEGRWKVATYGTEGKQVIVGYTNTELEGVRLYRKEKVRLAADLAEKYKGIVDQKVYDYFSNFTDHIDRLIVGEI